QPIRNHNNSSNSFSTNDPHNLTPSNPFLEEGGRRDGRSLEMALDMLISTSRCCHYLFNITNMRGKVPKFCIFKTGDIPCIQYSVSLQSEKEIEQGYQRRPESCLHTASSHFFLPVLHNPISTLHTHTHTHLTLRWRLHSLSRPESPWNRPPCCRTNQRFTVWTGTEHVDVDTFSWNLPIKVLPTNPALTSYVSQFTGTNSINV
uniref:Uncharacterized protein n=1 Tax=Salmo trutta TaxID=8032 RepID=A0A674B4B0_SALTR